LDIPHSTHTSLDQADDHLFFIDSIEIIRISGGKEGLRVHAELRFAARVLCGAGGREGAGVDHFWFSFLRQEMSLTRVTNHIIDLKVVALEGFIF
jgi:hypothetical protein